MDRDLNKFTLVWRIINFKTRVREGCRLYKGPIFVFKYDENSHWNLWFEDERDKCHIKLKRLCRPDETSGTVIYNINIKIICNEGENAISNEEQHSFRVSEKRFISLPINFENMLKNEKKIFNGNCLTLLVSMWEDYGDSFDINRITIDMEYFADSSSQNLEHSFVWDIIDFGEESVVEKRIIIYQFHFLFKISILEEIVVEVTQQNFYGTEPSFDVYCEVLPTHSRTETELLIQSPESSKTMKELRFPGSSKKSILKTIKSNFLHDGILSLRFKVVFTSDDFRKSSYAYEFPSLTKPSTEAKGMNCKCMDCVTM